MSEKNSSSSGNSDLKVALHKIKQAVATGRAEYIQLMEREYALTVERGTLPKKAIPSSALRDEITKHGCVAIDEATDRLSQFIANNISLFATQRTLNLSASDKLQEGSTISFERFDDAQANSKNSKHRPLLLPNVIAESCPIDPLILATVLLGKLNNQTPAEAFSGVLESISDRSLGYDRINLSGVGSDRATMVSRMAEIDTELELISQRKQDLLSELQELGVNTNKSGWMHEKDGQ